MMSHALMGNKTNGILVACMPTTCYKLLHKIDGTWSYGKKMAQPLVRQPKYLVKSQK